VTALALYLTLCVAPIIQEEVPDLVAVRRGRTSAP
jgi:hypothetical protein